MKILFVCLGNICRSSAAEEIMRTLVRRAGLEEVVEVDSAGILAYHQGELPDPRMRAHAARRGYTLTHRSRPVTTDDFYAFDLIIGMDDRNVDDLRERAPGVEEEAKVRRMADYCVRKAADCVPDPYYGGASGFENVLDILEDACAGLLDKLSAPTYSLIVPVYNRPDEVDELLDSLTRQTLGDFEVIVVEDGSTRPCADVAERYADRLHIRYYAKPNSGPGQTRNYGAERARGRYFIVLDSDCILPPGYLAAVDEELRRDPADAFGGPDRAHPSFTPVQKAINYAMTSFFTTGGIRGGRRQMERFHPRSFNMGIRADVYRALGGFSKMRFGEDIDFSIRIFRAGYRCRLFPGAWVWHKRRTDLRKFFRQVHNSGIARINLYKKYPDSLKAVHLLPAAFTVGTALLLMAAPWWPWSLTPLALFALIVCADAAARNRSLRIGLLAVAASFVQLTGYGSGFLRAWWQRCVRGRDEFSAFDKNFYK